MIQPLQRAILLEPSERPFEAQAVLNPGCITENGIVHMFYRAVYPGNYSSVGYCQLKDREVIYRHPGPVLKPEFPYEQHGIEDPRLIQVEDTYYMFYVGYSGKNARLCYAVSSDLKTFEKHGPITPATTYHELKQLCRILRERHEYYSYCHDIQRAHGDDTVLWEKDGFLFPEKIRGKFAFLHRILPDIQIIYADSLNELKDPRYWEHYLSNLEYYTFMRPRYWYESRYIGGGCPPIKTEAGWLFIYHAVDGEGPSRYYRASAALLDLEEPRHVLARLPDPLFEPEKQWERVGDVANVVFPTGTSLEGDRLDIFYGAADSRIGVISYSLRELLDELRRNTLQDTPNKKPLCLPPHLIQNIVKNPGVTKRSTLRRN